MNKHILSACVPAALLCALGAGAPAGAAVTVIDIDATSCGATACGNGSALSQSLGDSALIDVSHRSLNLDGTVYEPHLKYWQSSYGDLVGVSWAGANESAYRGQWIFTPVAGYEVSLIGFDAGCYVNRASCQTLNYTLTDLDGASLGGGSVPTNYPGHATVLANSAYSSTGLVFTWGPDAYDVGIDKIAFDVRAISTQAPVPEPATWALLLGGFALVGSAMRRRRTTVAFA